MRGSTATENTVRGGNFGANVTFATNLFSASGGGDVLGGHASGGNVCGDRGCTTDGRKRFYLTATPDAPTAAATACAAGFHFAALSEILDPSALAYAAPIAALAMQPESGVHGVPIAYGWIRTSAAAGTAGPVGRTN